MDEEMECFAVHGIGFAFLFVTKDELYIVGLGKVNY